LPGAAIALPPVFCFGDSQLTAGLLERLKVRLAELATGKSRAGLAQRSEAISEKYREFRASSGHIGVSDDVLAYAMSRMPATYAAVERVLDEAAARAAGFAPQTMLDAGAGPGTASWAAFERWPDLGSTTMMDHGDAFLRLAASLAEGALPATVVRGELGQTGLGDARFDLVVASYSLTELADGRVVAAALDLWRRCGGILAIIEPGRPRDYQRLMDVRRALLADGATMVAPCPHALECPLPEGDWCHFTVRLERSRDHMRMKGATLPYEDEKFSYLIVARPEVAAQPASRIIKPVERNKFAVTLELCAPGGLRREQVLKRNPEAFRVARKAEWGENWD